MTGRIVVGWTNTPEADAALDWSVNHALLTCRGVVLVHEEAPDPRSREDDGGRSAAARKLTAIEKGVSAGFPDLEFTTVVETGELAAGLLRWTECADLLAVGAAPVRCWIRRRARSSPWPV